MKVDPSTLPNSRNSTISNHMSQSFRRSADITRRFIYGEKARLLPLGQSSEDAVGNCVSKGVEATVACATDRAGTLFPSDWLFQIASHER